jgi:3-oxoacyl-[acyl-carrier-protein] synthase-3
MLFSDLRIESFGYEHPPLRVSSDEIEARLADVYSRLKLPPGRLELMSGVRERGMWRPGTPPSAGAVLAGEKALAAASFPRDKVGCLIMCSVCRDFLEPATATVVHSKLGLRDNCLVFDISNACLGMITALSVAGALICRGDIEAALLTAGESAGPVLENTISKMLGDKTITRQSVKPLFATLTLGSGAAAMLLCNERLNSSGLKVLGSTSLADTRHNSLCKGGAEHGLPSLSDALMETESETLMARGVDTAARAWEAFKKELAVDETSFDLVCAHQVGSAHKRLLYERLGLDRGLDFSTLEMFGNTGSVSCPMTAAMALEQKPLRKGGKAALLGIGSGINCAMTALEQI